MELKPLSETPGLGNRNVHFDIFESYEMMN